MSGSNGARNNGLPTVLISALTERISAGLGYPIEIGGLRRLTGGTSHDSWAMDAVSADGTHPLILRREFGADALDVSLAQESALLLHLKSVGAPVPRILTYAGANSQTGAAFAVSERMAGGDLRKRLAKTVADPASLGTRVARLQAELHGRDWRGLPPEFLNTHGPRDVAGYVGEWADIALAGTSNSDILLVGAIDRMMRTYPEDGAQCLVHGDFKANNIVCDSNGDAGDTALAVIDWELAHVGDPLEDLAWTMLWTTRFDIVGGLLTPEDYVAAYEVASGTTVDRDRLTFWRLFALVKLMAIFVRSADLDRQGCAPRPTHAMLLRAAPWIHRQIAGLLAREPQSMESRP